MLIDLQLHSIYSDGYLHPHQLAEMLQKKGIKVAALTDHNTVGGSGQFADACAKRGIKAINAIELYVKLNHKRFNILWYNFDKNHPDLHKLLYATHIKRRANTRKTLIALKKAGFRLDIDKILDKYNRYIPINHIVDDFLSEDFNVLRVKKQLKEKILREEDVMREYFFNSKYGILHESYINIERVMALKKKIGGQIVLNHPGKNNCLKRHLLERLKNMGFDGIEVISAHHSIGATMYAQYMANEYNFIETGGSDFHKSEGGLMPIQNCYDYFHIDSKLLKGIDKIIGKIDN
ncbi:MAG: PHP domain-containing protein [bacterium]